MRIILHLFLSCLAVAIADYLLPGISFDNTQAVVVVTVVLGVVNILIKPIISLVLLPLNILTLGLLGFLVNGLIILVVDQLVVGFQVENFWSALLFSILLSLISLFFSVIKR